MALTAPVIPFLVSVNAIPAMKDNSVINNLLIATHNKKTVAGKIEAIVKKKPGNASASPGITESSVKSHAWSAKMTKSNAVVSTEALVCRMDSVIARRVSLETVVSSTSGKKINLCLLLRMKMFN